MLRVFGRALLLYFRNFIAIGALTLVVALPLASLNFYFEPYYSHPSALTGLNWGKTMVDAFERIFIFSISIGGIIHLLESQRRQEKVRLLELVRAGIRVWPRLASARLFVEAILFVSAGLGAPLPYFYVKYSLVDIHVVVAGDSPDRAMQGSFDLTRSHFWPMAGIFLLAFASMAPIVRDYCYFISWNGGGSAFYHFFIWIEQPIVLAFIPVLQWCLYHHFKDQTLVATTTRTDGEQNA